MATRTLNGDLPLTTSHIRRIHQFMWTQNYDPLGNLRALDRCGLVAGNLADDAAGEPVDVAPRWRSGSDQATRSSVYLRATPKCVRWPHGIRISLLLDYPAARRRHCDHLPPFGWQHGSRANSRLRRKARRQGDRDNLVALRPRLVRRQQGSHLRSTLSRS